MKVKELIAQLQTMDGDFPVLTADYRDVIGVVESTNDKSVFVSIRLVDKIANVDNENQEDDWRDNPYMDALGTMT